ncbi:Sphinganine C4-monooxygenase [Lachnellula willkommii]|uniref:Sphinganine C4-monooxygenase n=1 Tax=Lachnellula willkommii TaxID=215461 RepID=A0A559MN01_9HELO|nr:Sphinganine C4-monooxygenase [Lachnellula willkommii]
MALFQQATQITLGYLTADDKEVFYPHVYHVERLVQNINAAQLFLTGVFCNPSSGPFSAPSKAIAICPNLHYSNTTATSFGSLLPQQTINDLVTAGSQHTQWQWLASQLIYWVLIPTFQFLFALILADTFQYFMHRAMHTRWLYKNIHYLHHDVYVPYAYGAYYNHPLESIPIDSIGYPLGLWLAGMNNRQAALFGALWTFKSVIDHCGYDFPWNPCNIICPDSVIFHDLHHQSWGLKYNFSVYMDFWDRWFGTRWDARDVRATEKYKRSIEAAEKAVEKDRTAKGEKTVSTALSDIRTTALSRRI